ncbi:DNA-formamidopyrimidine glycosylase family protein, partial [Streptomyces sp. NPDC057557]|uniref:DNA-formamidopyrimidine glycosylase family protein n=1 Tax=Streptomyces sp. NPDC057557 TaxID=3346167 RepID=UPI003681A245
MPELPEVEALRVFLDEHLVGKEIDRVLPLTPSGGHAAPPPHTTPVRPRQDPDHQATRTT